MVDAIYDPVYIPIAAQIAAGIGGGNSTGQGVLAQIACEKNGANPYQDNNPLNVHVDAMASVGVTGLAHGVGDFGACASFASLQDGANAAIQLLTRASRYQAAIADARRDDGLAYLRDVTAAGWGTSFSCAQGKYNTLTGGKVATGPTSGNPGSGGGASSTGGSTGTGVGATGTAAPSLAQFLGKSSSDTLTSSDIDKLADAWYAAVHPVDVGGAINTLFHATLHGALDGQIGQPISSVHSSLLGAILGTIGAVPGVGAQAAGSVVPDVAGAIQTGLAGIAAAMVQLLVYGAIIAGILVLGYLGVRRLLAAG